MSMDARLKRLIGDYQHRVAEAVNMLASIGIPRPSSNTAWVGSDDPPGGQPVDGFSFYKHGFGCAVVGPEWRVDFDFGANGEIDGFDAGRLHGFARERLSDYGFASAEEIERAVKDATAAGDLTFSGYIIFYVADNGLA